MADQTEAWGAHLVVKVKEPQPEEFAFLRPDLVLFTYLHLAAYPAVGRALLQAGTTAIAYETVQLAARLAAAMDAEVFLLDLSPERLRRLESQRQGRLVSSRGLLERKQPWWRRCSRDR